MQRILRLRWLEAYRTLRDEWVVFFLFFPLVFGVSLVLALRVIEDLSNTVPYLQSRTVSGLWNSFSFLLIPLSSFYFFRFILLRLYPIQNSDLLFFSLPLTPAVRFFTLLLDLSVRNLPLAMVYLLGHQLMKGTYLMFPLIPSLDAGVLQSLVWIPLVSTVLSVFQILFIQAATYMNLLTVPRLFLSFVPFAVFGFYGGRWWETLNHFGGWGIVLGGFFIGLCGLLAWMGIPFSKYINLWRIESFLAGERRVLYPFLKIFFCWIPRRFRHFLMRDALLTARNFSSRFILYPLAVLLLLTGYGFLIQNGISSPYLIYLVCAAAVFSLTSMIVPLFGSTFPFLWIDGSVPVNGEDFFHSKIIFSLLAVFFIPVVCVGIVWVWGSGLPSGQFDPHGNGFIYLLFRLCLLTLFVAGGVAAFLFEGEQHPLLHKIITFLAAVLVTYLMALHWLFIILMPMFVQFLRETGLPRLKRIIAEH